MKRMGRREFLGHATAGAVAAAMMPRAHTQETAAIEEPQFRFGLLTDIQYWDGDPAGSRFYRNSPDKLKACVEDLNGMDLAHVLQLGDFIDRHFVSFKRVLPLYEGLKAPQYHVLGNHDFSVAGDKRDKVAATLGMPARYYDFAHGGWRFVVLDGNDLSLHGRKKGSAEYEQAQAMYAKLREAGAENAQTWNGGVGEKQLAWLRSTLKDASAAGERVLVFCHFPLYPQNVHNLWNAEVLMDVLESAPCVAAYINGHNHAGNYGARNGVHYLTLKGMVETPDSTAYATVEVYKDRLELLGKGREPSRSLTLRHQAGAKSA